ncbi:hypothetical protein [Ahrensia kielensis]|uniref:hypothetical protein n=1 Tax=Ahrensia kielensis TaxID=76980 RepID=UPI0012EAB064|nr:hypothetical protein [Ahrensia kielensis]
MSSDELGTSGERKFPTYCAGLVVNKSTEDRAGWDYLLDATNEDVAKEDFQDLADDILSAKVQLKTLWHDNSRVKIKLRALQRLTSYNGPAFLIVMKLNNDQEVVGLFAKHVLDDFFELALRKLTLAGQFVETNAASSFTVDNSWTEICYSEAYCVRNYLNSVLKQYSSGVEYAQKKSDQRKNLGVDTGSHRMEFSINGEEIEQLLDASIGLSAATISKGKIFQKRFGIERVIQQLPTGTKFKAVISKSSGDFCTLANLDEDGIPSNQIVGQLITPPAQFVFNDHSKVRFIGNGIEMRISTGKKETVTLNIDYNAKLHAQQWRQLNDFLIAFSGPVSEFTLKTQLGSAAFKVTEGALITSLIEPVVHLVSKLHIISAIWKAFDLPEEKFSLSDFYQLGECVSQAFYLTKVNEGHLKLSFEKIEKEPLGKLDRICFVRRIKMFGADIAYWLGAQVCTIESNGRHEFVIQRILGTGNCAAALFDADTFVKPFCQKHKIEISIYENEVGYQRNEIEGYHLVVKT